jgi:hypothetical protein
MKKAVVITGGCLTAVVAVVVFVVFQPQRLLFDDVVEEARPEPTPQPMAELLAPRDPFKDAPEGTLPAKPEVTEAFKGSFVALDHPTSGTAEVIPVADGGRVLRLEDFTTDNGPDLFVYLTPSPGDGSQPFDQDYVDLGRLKGNVGAQNYPIPSEVDLDKYSTVVIWCQRFGSAFGAAEMSAQ